jgi:hypothetical protein
MHLMMMDLSHNICVLIFLLKYTLPDISTDLTAAAASATAPTSATPTHTNTVSAASIGP